MICTYQDHAEDEEVETSAGLVKLDQDGPEQIVFPVKLHNMLSQVDRQGLSHVVSWASHGRCFLIHKKNEFVTKILASWFRQSKFASFQRQLNLYGFKRITTGPDKGGYYHELFLRSKPFLCPRIDRVKIKGSRPGRIKTYADAEPDFYRMKPMPAVQEDQDISGRYSRNSHDQASGDREQAPASRSGSPSVNERQEQEYRQVLANEEGDRPGQLKKTGSTSEGSGSDKGSPDLHPTDFGQPYSNGFDSNRMSFLSSQPQLMTVSTASSESLTGLFGLLHRSQDCRSVVSREECDDLTTPLSSFHKHHQQHSDSTANTSFGHHKDTSEEAHAHRNSTHIALTRANLRQDTHHGAASNLGALREDNLLRDSNSNTSSSYQTRSLEASQQHRFPHLFQPLNHFASSSPLPQGPSTLTSSTNSSGDNHLHNLSIDMFQMPNEFLSEYLPTAEALTMENLFDSPTSDDVQHEEQKEEGRHSYPSRPHSEPIWPSQRRRHSLDDETPVSFPTLYFDERDSKRHHEV